MKSHTFVSLGSLSLVLVGLMSACAEEPYDYSKIGNRARGGSSGAGGGGASAGGGSAGTGNTAGSAGSALSSAGSAGAGGTAGSAGSAGSGGSAGGAVCDPDDECCDDPATTAPGECGCGVADDDTDADGELDCNEACPQDPDKTEPGECGCGSRENDSDDDGVIDCQPGHYFEAEDGVLSVVDAPIVGPGEGGAGGGGGAPAVDLPKDFTIGEDAAASSAHYLESPAGFVADAQPGPARASYEIEILDQDSYVFWGRFYTPGRDHNRLWVRVDEGEWTKLRVTTGEAWFWYTFHAEGQFATPISYELTEGLHTLTIASDTDGVRVDRFYVTPGGDIPPGNDTNCNPPHSILMGGVCQSSCGGLQGNSCDAVMCEGLTPLPAYDCEICCQLP